MKWKYFILLSLLVIIPFSPSFGFGEKLGVRLESSGIKSLYGSFNDSTAMSDYLDPGMSYGIGIVHRISNYYTVEVSVDVGWMAVKENQRAVPSKRPVFFFPRISFSNLVSFPIGRIVPYTRLGVSIVPWKFTQDGPGGETTLFEGEKFQKISFGLHGGLGLELRLTNWFSVYGEGTFHYLLCRDEFFFGKGFTEQGILRFGGGIIFYPFSL